MKKTTFFLFGILLALFGFFTWKFLPQNPFSPLEESVIYETIQHILTQIPLSENGILVWVLPFRGDEASWITTQFRIQLDRSGKAKVLSDEELSLFLKKQKLDPFLFNHPRDASILLERFQVGGLFVGEIQSFLRTPEKTTLQIEITLLRPKQDSVTWKGQASVTRNFFSWKYLTLYFSSFSFGVKAFLFLAGILFFPIGTVFLIAFLLRQDHNGITFVSLIAYLLLDIIWILLLFGGVPATLWGTLFLGFLVAFSAFYNYGIFTEIKDYFR